MVIIADSKVFFYVALQRHWNLPKMFHLIVKEIQYSLKAYPFNEPVSAILFVGDLGKSEYRRSIYPQYKGHRNYPDRDKEAQDHYIGTLPRIAEAMDMIPAFISGVEADDIAGIATRDIRLNTPEKVLVMTADHDWRQLVLKYDNVFLKSINDSTVQTPSYVREKEGIDNYFEFLLKKAMVGDVSDNIKGLHYCGHGCFTKFLYRLRKIPAYASMEDKERYAAAVEMLGTLPKIVKPHKYYQKDGQTATLEDALRTNFQLGEIITHTSRLTADQKRQYEEYREAIRKRIVQRRPITPDMETVNSIIENFMPNETNDFGGPALLPTAYGEILHSISKGGF